MTKSLFWNIIFQPNPNAYQLDAAIVVEPLKRESALDFITKQPVTGFKEANNEITIWTLSSLPSCPASPYFRCQILRKNLTGVGI